MVRQEDAVLVLFRMREVVLRSSFGKTAQHIENAAVPCLRGRTNVRSDFAHLGVHVVEQAGEVARDAIYQNAFYPFLDDLTNQAKIPPFPRPPM